MASGQLSQKWLDQENEWIEAFFRDKVPQALQKLGVGDPQCTAESCNKVAKELLGSDDVRLVDNQGAKSYTLICDSQKKIVQFRLEPLEKRMLDLAHEMYQDLVPSPTLMKDTLLPVYTCPVIPGVVHILQDFPKDNFPLQRQLNTVQDLAAFVARAAFWPQPPDALTNDSWTASADAKLKSLAEMAELNRLEPRFAQKAAELSSKLHLLEKLPLVLTNLDFAEVNIMVDAQSGHLTGVLDFDGARVEAFGMCLFGVYEGFFGVMHDRKWRFFDEPAAQGGENSDDSKRSVRETLEAAFWDTLWEKVPSWMKRGELQEAVTVALDLGIINRYFSKGGDVSSQDESDLRSINWATGLLLDR